MQQILLRSNVQQRVTIASHSISSTRTGVGTISATMQYDSAGVATGSGVGTVITGGGIYTPEWMLIGPSSAYDIMWTNAGAAVTGSATSTWLNLATTRSWTLTQGVGIGASSAVGTVQIRDATTLLVLASTTIFLDVERT